MRGDKALLQRGTGRGENVSINNRTRSGNADKHNQCLKNSIHCKALDNTTKDPTTRKVAGSIPDDVVKFANLTNPSSRTMALESNRPVTEMSTRIFSG
jgi:hypothetical protein